MPGDARKPEKSDARTSAPGRYWPLDFLAAIALLFGTIYGARMTLRMLGVVPALFFCVVGLGLTYHYFRGAWRSVRRGREEQRRYARTLPPPD